MPVEYKDYYQTLGVARDADAEQIHKAFRKLARQYHPDVAKNKAVAEEKFKEINEAYEVLGDPEKRRKYDALGADWQAGAQFRPPPGWSARAGRGTARGEGFDTQFDYQFGGTGFSDFFEQLFGSMRAGRSGFGRSAMFGSQADDQPGRDTETEILVGLDEVVHGSIRPITVRRLRPCPQCQGSGLKGRRTCTACKGQGQVAQTDHYQVKIPAGVSEGQRLRLRGHGEAGSGSAPAGDLYLRVRLAKHPDFRVQGGDLYVDVPLAPWEAVLGANVTVPTMNGRLNIKIPPGTQNGQTLRVRAKGLPNRSGGVGDLYVVLHLQVPNRLGDRERACWEELARESTFHPRD